MKNVIDLLKKEVIKEGKDYLKVKELKKAIEILQIASTPLTKWNVADKDGIINVPDHLDALVNKIGFQFRFVTLSNKNELQAVCDTAFIAQKFFTSSEVIE